MHITIHIKSYFVITSDVRSVYETDESGEEENEECDTCPTCPTCESCPDTSIPCGFDTAAIIVNSCLFYNRGTEEQCRRCAELGEERCNAAAECTWDEGLCHFGWICIWKINNIFELFNFFINFIISHIKRIEKLCSYVLTDNRKSTNFDLFRLFFG